MRRSFCLWFLACVAPLAAAPLPPLERLPRPIPAISRVVIVSVDGLRPDVLLLADTPVLHGMAHRGAYSFWAETTATGITLPSHASMLTGAIPDVHKIQWNIDLPLAEPVYPRVPTLFELAKRAGYSTAFIAGKTKLIPLLKPGTLDYELALKDNPHPDETVAAKAEEIIATLRPEVLFVHLPACDTAGHAHGWGSPEQFAAIARADACIGRIMAALEKRGLAGSTLAIVTSDHGGAGLTHGPDDARSRHIPWILSGPGVKKSWDLTLDPALVVRVEDTCATACWVLGVPQQEHFRGKPVVSAFEAAK